MAPLTEMLLPVVLHLEAQQEQISQLLEMAEHPVTPQPTTAPETRELLLEILNSLQPPPEMEIARQLGLPTRPLSSPSSAS